MSKKVFVFFGVVFSCFFSFGQNKEHEGKFEQMGTLLRSPNVFRTASGAPGGMYWQQKADYLIKVELNDKNQSITASETITYTNNSPDNLTYLWLQLDQNRFKKESDTYKVNESSISEKVEFDDIKSLLPTNFDGGFKITSVKDARGANLTYTINKTMMRVELVSPLKKGETFSFSIDWNFNILDHHKLGGRSGFEYFKKDENYLYELAQWFPRMAVYSDNDGWQHKQFLGRGEFTLPFGDYEVHITVPADFVVAATGELQNSAEVLTKEQIERFEAAKKSDKPHIIISQKEAEKNEKSRSTEKKTWKYKAQNVRDFAWAGSRKFIWDAMGVSINGKNIMAMSYYPKEGNPLWGQYSTEAVAHTLKVYSKYTIDYPYPVAISVHGPVYGMEYPMIAFNGGRPEPDGTYTERLKYSLITVIIHEVGHNFFPMIINSDERQWSWMDEGLNTFVQFLAEQEWDRNYPSSRGPAAKIVPYMKGDKSFIRPIMTNSENIVQFGNNAYGKPATALNILRETIMGRELFDYAFKEYARRWAFKHPTPEDFFRTMEDASAVDLDWFWKGWFYTVDHVDIAMKSVKWYKIDTQNPETENPLKQKEKEETQKHISKVYNEKDIPVSLVEAKPQLKDFYNSYNEFVITPEKTKSYKEFIEGLDEEEKKLLNSGLNFYEIHFKNNGGLVMPLVIEFTYKDGSKEIDRIPAEIWRINENYVKKVFVKSKEVISIALDPNLETADTDMENNYFPERNIPSRLELYKKKEAKEPNPMQKK